jgi:hypothetical protein
MKTRNPSEPRETFLKEVAYRKLSGQGIPFTLSGDFDLSNSSESLESLNNAIALVERILEKDEVLEHNFPEDRAIDAKIHRALYLMQWALWHGKLDAANEIYREIRRITKIAKPIANQYLARLLAESQIGPVNILALARQLAQDENGIGRTPSEVAAVEDQIPRIYKTLYRYRERLEIRVLPAGRPKTRKDIESDDRD